MKEIANPADYMLKSGILFEWNRTMLHPIGLGLAVRPCDHDPSKMEFALYDYTDNPVVTFDPATFNRGQAKWREYWTKEGIAVNKLRKRRLGINSQTRPDYRTQSDYKEPQRTFNRTASA